MAINSKEMKTKNKLNYTLGCIISVSLYACKSLEANGGLTANIISVPCKIRPSVKGVPEQLNTNFSAALYLGSRKGNSKHGFSYGAFTGLSAITMNPHVTEDKIDYEYDGLALSNGIAGIYDNKKINIGLALGIDMLTDKNRTNWIYQGKPWIGILFGITLN